MSRPERGAELHRRRDLLHRSNEAEWLDGANLDADELAPVLRDLARFNTAMLGHWPVLRWLGRATSGTGPGRSLSLLDAGCGYGDLLRAIRRWASRRRLAVSLIGVDLNPDTIRIAKAATGPRDGIAFAAADVLQFRPAAPVDLIVSSLLAHHLADEAIVELLRWMDRTARRGWLICDLQRHRVPYHAIGVAGRLLAAHPVVIHDGRISVTRALTLREWRDLVAASGIPRDGLTIGSFLYRCVIGRTR